MRIIVSDTGALLHLHETNLTGLLGRIGTVQVPVAVDSEMSDLVPDWRATSPDWRKVRPLSAGAKAEAESWVQAGLMHPGEAEAIALARELRANWLLTDDAAARLFARALGLEVHGSLGVVLWAAAQRHLDRTNSEAALHRLAGSSLWISASVLAEARAALERIFA